MSPFVTYIQFLYIYIYISNLTLGYEILGVFFFFFFNFFFFGYIKLCFFLWLSQTCHMIHTKCFSHKISIVTSLYKDQFKQHIWFGFTYDYWTIFKWNIFNMFNSQVTLLTYCIYVHSRGYTLEIWELHIKRNSK
jgi:hypothetical protein